MSRSSLYSDELADRICVELSSGRSLREICAAEEMPDKATIFRWLAANEPFRDQYIRAREAQADAMLEEIIEIADDGINDTYVDEDGETRVVQDVVARSRLRVDARKWAMSKMAPKKYGDKIEQTIKADGLTALFATIAERGQKLVSEADGE
jgi:hypothetical protein